MSRLTASRRGRAKRLTHQFSTSPPRCCARWGSLLPKLLGGGRSRDWRSITTDRDTGPLPRATLHLGLLAGSRRQTPSTSVPRGTSCRRGRAVARASGSSTTLATADFVLPAAGPPWPAPPLRRTGGGT